MGKKNKHSKDKLHKTVTELKSHHVGANRDLELSVLHRRLRFDSCCLSLNSVSNKPVGLCDDDGYCYVFECDIVIKFLGKFQVHPITGKKITVKDIIELKLHRNNEGQYHCPVIYKLFTQHSKIVANRKSGNVYSYEAYQQLNLKPDNLKDLLTDEPFEKNDIVTIQDPSQADVKWNVSNFYYVKNKLKIDDDTGDSKIRDIEQSDILKSSLNEYRNKADSIVETFNRIVGQNVESRKDGQTKLDTINSANYSDGVLSSCVTSTIMPVASSQKAALLNDDEIIYPKIKKKGYAQLLTNFGPLNLELYCDRAPKACHNFFLLASRGYYDGTCFHRLIKNFILQGGDPSGTGKGGQSAWGKPFKDECHGDLKHVGRGVLAMANSGPNTNKSQFYITLKGVWDHLDGKHTVFGRVVGGDETLEKIESVEVDKEDRPKKDIKILQVVKYVDPFEEVEAAIAEERKKEADDKKRSAGSASSSTKGGQPLKKFRSGVGAYINLDQIHNSKLSNSKKEQQRMSDETGLLGVKTNGLASLSSKLAGLSNPRKSAKSLGDFSNW